MSAHRINAAEARDKLGGAELVGVDASDLRVVSLDFHSGSTTEHIVLSAHVDRLVAASKRLHFRPGVNPHNGNETSRIWRIRVSELRANGPYWWATPNLNENGDPAGAFIIQPSIAKTVWQDPDFEVDA